MSDTKDPTSGRISLEGKDPKAISAAELKALAEAFKNAKPIIESEAAMIRAAAGIMKGTK